MEPTQAATYGRYRIQVFASTWLCYVGFYFCRHAFYIVKPTLTTDLGLDAGALGDIGMVYLVAYTAGQFVSAAVGERVGARLLLLVGMGISACANLVFGFSNGYWTFMAFMAFNGLAQATGWSGNVGTMARWFRRRERGTVMGFWATCYQVGGALAKGFAAFMLGLWGWRWSFWGATLVLSAVWVVFLLLQRNRPEDVGLPPLDDPDEPGPAANGEASAPSRGWSGQMVLTIGIVGVAYFFIKFIRYALWSWTSYLLNLNYGLAADSAGYFSTLFDLFGFLGVIAAGVLSDRLFRGRRTQVSLSMLVLMAATTLVLYGFGGQSLLVFGASIAIIGFALYGPDSLLSGAGAIDAGEGRHAIAAAGIINGLGSFGAVAQEKVVGWLYETTSSAGAAAASLAETAAGTALACANGALGVGPAVVPGLLPARGVGHVSGSALQDLTPIFLTLAGAAVLAAACIFVLWLLARKGYSRL